MSSRPRWYREIGFRLLNSRLAPQVRQPLERDFSLDGTISQLACQVVQRTRAVLRLGLLLLLCSPSLLLASSGADVLHDSRLLDHGDPALLTTLREHVPLPQHAEGDAGDERDEPPPWQVSVAAARFAGPSGSLVFLSDGRERLPDPPDYLQARLRAPPLCNPRL